MNDEPPFSKASLAWSSWLVDRVGSAAGEAATLCMTSRARVVGSGARLTLVPSGSRTWPPAEARSELNHTVRPS